MATRKKGLEELRCTVCDISKTKRLPENRVQYDAQLEPLLRKLEVELGSIALSKKISARWLAIKVLEKDPLADQTLGVDRALCQTWKTPYARRNELQEMILICLSRMGDMGLLMDWFGMLPREVICLKNHLQIGSTSWYYTAFLGFRFFLCDVSSLCVDD